MMEFKELTDFARKENQRIHADQVSHSKEMALLGRMVKLSEETGELAEQVLHSVSLQRKAKRENKEGSLDDEFADVVLVALILADEMGVDLEAALQKKIERINKRYE
jgi:NTP pyrophosphatase (non-canonical NTP hydrolase)